VEEGFQVIRCQLGEYGAGGFIDADEAPLPKNAWPVSRVFDEELYVDNVVAMFDYLRDKLGFGIKLTHDVHEHLRPNQAVSLAKRLEPYRLFFLEDVLPPEQTAYFRQIRQRCTTPQAMGELFVNVQEYLPLISERLIDFIRVRVSKAAVSALPGKSPICASSSGCRPPGRKVVTPTRSTRRLPSTWT
jgi:mannonate dehydratase